MFPVHERLGRRKLFMMHGPSPLHTPPALMLYSGALSIASHNRVDANATTGAPQQRQKNRAPFRGVDRPIQPYLPRAGAHDGERPVRAPSLALLATTPHWCRRWQQHKACCQRIPCTAGVTLNFVRYALHPAPSHQRRLFANTAEIGIV